MFIELSVAWNPERSRLPVETAKGARGGKCKTQTPSTDMSDTEKTPMAAAAAASPAKGDGA